MKTKLFIPITFLLFAACASKKYVEHNPNNRDISKLGIVYVDHLKPSNWGTELRNLKTKTGEKIYSFSLATIASSPPQMILEPGSYYIDLTRGAFRI